jgi:hypothetical protein
LNLFLILLVESKVLVWRRKNARRKKKNVLKMKNENLKRKKNSNFSVILLKKILHRRHRRPKVKQTYWYVFSKIKHSPDANTLGGTNEEYHQYLENEFLEKIRKLSLEFVLSSTSQTGFFKLNLVCVRYSAV